MSLVEDLEMDKTQFSIADLSDESDEAAYWQAQTPQVRLEALECHAAGDVWLRSFYRPT